METRVRIRYVGRIRKADLTANQFARIQKRPKRSGPTCNFTWINCNTGSCIRQLKNDALGHSSFLVPFLLVFSTRRALIDFLKDCLRSTCWECSLDVLSNRILRPRIPAGFRLRKIRVSPIPWSNLWRRNAGNRTCSKGYVGDSGFW